MADIRTNDAPAATLAAPPLPAQPAAAHADPAAATAQHDRLAERLDGQPAPPPAVSPPLAAAPASTTRQPPPSTTSDAARAVRFRSSATNEWDRMPAEIQNMILKHAGVLTLWVNGRIGNTNFSDKQCESLLRDVFELDWQGDLRKLPFHKFKIYPTIVSLRYIRTRSMYARFKALNGRSLDDGLDQAAILNGWTDLLEFRRPEDIGRNATRCGSITMLEHLVDERKVVTLSHKHARFAAQFGQLDVLKWLHERMPDGSWSAEVMDCAAEYGHLSVVKWLHANRTEGSTTNAMDYAAWKGHLAVVKWLHANRTEGCTFRAMDSAASSGCLAVVEWLYANCTEHNLTSAAIDAAWSGKLSSLQLIKKLAPDVISAALVDDVAHFASLSILQWIMENTGVVPTEECITKMVQIGRFDTLPWFRKRTPEVFHSHAVSQVGNESADAVIDWLDRDDLSRAPADVARLAIRERQIMVVKWLLEHWDEKRWQNHHHDIARLLVRTA
ncbi:hypothetical protein HK105_208383 [Polyrhizophydium stewartii]|uniref:Ankyrin repeat protein n=1 Tax=Polyrhizophydium stewartii TaxID=2732419 RepID=A0ABR4MXW5_9FUNG